MERTPIYVEVYGTEASIIEEARRINQMIDETNRAIHGPDTICPLRQHNEEQRAIIGKALEIERKYQSEYNSFSKSLANLLAGNAAVKATRKRLGKENKRGYEGICLK